jgi:hypothetical protein
MAWDLLQDNWKQFKGKIKQCLRGPASGSLGSLDEQARRDELVERIQQLARDEVRGHGVAERRED